MTTQISASNIQPATLSALDGPTVTNIQVTDSSYTVLDDTAVALSGGYIKITGTNFSSGCSITIGTVSATSVTFIDSTTLHVHVPSATAGTYVVYVINSDGAVAIRVNGLTYSSEPTWVTGSALSGDSGTAVSIQLSATGASVYSLQEGSTLPANLTLTSGGLISGVVTVENETLYNFTVIATDAELQDSPRSFSITISVGDTYFNLTTLLLPGNANTFINDASTNNSVLTIVGDTKPSSFSPYAPGYYSNLFDGTGDYLEIPANTAFDFGSANFTIECWVYPLTTGVVTGFVSNWQSGGQFIFRKNTANRLQFVYKPVAIAAVTVTGTTTTVVTSQWNHVAVVRNGNIFTMYVNGVADATTSTSSAALEVSGKPVRVGVEGDATGPMNGYISNARIVNGTAVYISNFTPPTNPLTTIEGTCLLTCQNSQLVDSSTNNFVVTRFGDTRVSSFIPYIPSTVYDSYGSTYFDGTGDSLQAVSPTEFTLASDNFTIEMWFNTPTKLNSTPVLISNGNFGAGKWQLNERHSGTPTKLTFNVYNASTSNGWLTSTSVINNNIWYHVAIVRNGSTFTMYVNGVAEATATFAGSVTSGAQTVYVGQDAGQTGTNYNGYITDARIVKGTAVYTANFTPPAAPLTAITNTVLLTCQSNQPVNNNVFLDSSTNNFLVTRAGNPTQGTFSPYGENWSNYFDGTSDSLTTPAPNGTIGTGDFTIEAWVYYNRSIFDAYNDIISTRGTILCLNSGKLRLYGLGVASSYTLPINTWVHVAATRQSGIVKLFADGVVVQQFSDSTSVAWSNPAYIGSYDGGTGEFWFGYISNLRLVAGTAVYTSNFTPSTTPLQTVPGTVLLTCQSPNLVDRSPNNYTITKNGDVSVQKFGPFAGATLPSPYYSVYFNGGGNTLSATLTSAIGTQDFTYEAWVYRTSTSADENIITGGSTNTGGWNMAVEGQKLRAQFASTNFLYSTSDIPTGAWCHCAISRQGSTVRVFVNGVLENTGTSAYDSTATLIQVGSWTVGGTSYDFTGYISNARIVVGSAVYTSTFTPPTAPLTPISGTQLLLCHAATVVDGSANAYAITVTGTGTRLSTFTPYILSYSTKQNYTPQVNGGSMYFDGTGDYLTIPYNAAMIPAAGTDFTAECWIYITGSTSVLTHIMGMNSTTVANWFIKNENGTLQAQIGNPAAGSLGSATANTWIHLAVVQRSNAIFGYRDGVLAFSAGIATSWPNNGVAMTIGARSGPDRHFVGYIAGVRVLKGIALYTSNFVPANRPPTPITNTTLLLNGTSGAVINSSQTFNLETVGDAKISTAVSKFGGSSMYFDGTGDRLALTSTPLLQFGTGAFTIEFWLYSLDSADRFIFSIGLWGGTAGVGMIQYQGNYAYGSGAAWPSNAGQAITPNVWRHIAITRTGGSLRFFFDGVLKNTSTDSNNLVLNTLSIGSGDIWANYSGYIQDFRITTGFARYTANFIPPTAAFKPK